MGWARVSASDLLAYQGDPTDLLGSGSAIYMWKRHFRPTAGDMANSEHFMSWLERAVSAPVAEVEKVRVAHFLTLSGIALSGELTADKRSFLSNQAKSMKGRQRIATFLRDLAEQTPALYVGETSEISKRPFDHLAGETDFGTAVASSTNTDWDDLDFHYLLLNISQAESDIAKKYRTALEQIAANVTIAGMTRRAG